MSALPPGATIGILGAGQLGRMLGTAAAQLGYRTVSLSPDENPPAAQTTSAHIRAGYNEEEALSLLAAQSDVITYEFENVPSQAAEFLASKVEVRPGPRALEVAQDRLIEKEFLKALGVPTADFGAVDGVDDARKAAAALGAPFVIKTRRFGYDGKGQALIRSEDEIQAKLADLPDRPKIAEAFVDFEREISMIIARGEDGKMRAYPPIHNVHEDHILRQSSVPAGIGGETEAAALTIAQDVAEALRYVGVLTIEMFVTRDGGLLVNELAPRVHNSGHWTIEGAVTSQFENHIRAIAGLPLGATEALGVVGMRNLLGKEVLALDEDFSSGDAHVHIYGKAEPRDGRKMGHVTRIRSVGSASG